jgi:hypothetical protein
MGVPVLGGLVHGLADCSPPLNTPPLEGQRAQHLPPGFNQVHGGGIRRLEDELPTGRRQRAPQDLGGPMSPQMIHDRLDPLDSRSNPPLHRRQAVHSVGRGPAGRGRRQGFTIGGREGAEEGPLAPPPLVTLLRSPPGRGGGPARDPGRGSGCWPPPRRGAWQCPTCRFLHGHQLPSRQALRTLRPHLLQAHDDTARRRCRRERRDAPRVSAKAGSTRSPTQVACGRPHPPAPSNRSSRRGRFIGSPFTSWRYAARRSRGQLAHGQPSSWGLVKLVALTSLPCSGVSSGGRPGRGFSRTPAHPWRWKRMSQLRTVAAVRGRSWAMAGPRRPWWASQMMRARSTGRAGAVRGCARCRIVSTSVSVIGRTRHAMGHLLWPMPQMIPMI